MLFFLCFLSVLLLLVLWREVVKKKETVVNTDVFPTTSTNTEECYLGIANVLTDNNQEIEKEVRNLIEEPLNFAESHRKWLTFMGFDVHTDIELILVYALVGYETTYYYGIYIDWKEETGDILGYLDYCLE